MSCTHIGNAIVCTSPESESKELDLRTRKGQEEHILRQIRDHGGFSIFWATDNQKRAHAVDRLIDSGKIIRGNDQYPWCSYTINGESQ